MLERELGTLQAFEPLCEAESSQFQPFPSLHRAPRKFESRCCGLQKYLAPPASLFGSSLSSIHFGHKASDVCNPQHSVQGMPVSWKSCPYQVAITHAKHIREGNLIRVSASSPKSGVTHCHSGQKQAIFRCPTSAQLAQPPPHRY